MKRASAAAYLELSPAEFEREVAAGRLPQPFRLGNHEHWSKDAIDKAIARLSGEQVASWRDRSGLYGQTG
ncbi:hypothetical protein D9601_03535 [Sphingomonas sp. MA1305]|uniref:hypothetical protein n=1 Tax=Sphingomonas sp. MA1305 TaxID=2479204 RepID=UPI0018E03CF0|nr:hypothetical protein [Sphingomonas sp. MA1305]MBI0474436.1 hypothetical protein [Sphingomonas sp. MA1305]